MDNIRKCCAIQGKKTLNMGYFVLLILVPLIIQNVPYLECFSLNCTTFRENFLFTHGQFLEMFCNSGKNTLNMGYFVLLILVRSIIQNVP
jgi:hypothetical protein